jgi:hypothetical protein
VAKVVFSGDKEDAKMTFFLSNDILFYLFLYGSDNGLSLLKCDAKTFRCFS